MNGGNPPSGRRGVRGNARIPARSKRRSEQVATGTDPDTSEEMGGVGALLAGVRVLEVGRGIAAAYCGKLFADLGADVLRLASPEDMPRRAEAEVADRGRAALDCFLHGAKRHGELPPDDGAIPPDAVAPADVVISTQSVPTLRRRGLDPEQLADAGKILISITNFGLDQPGREELLPDLLHAALGGFVLLAGDEGRPPVRNGASLPQFQAALLGAIAGLGALYARDLGGGGDIVDLSLLEAVVFLLEREDIVYTHQHTTWRRRRRHQVVHPFMILPCRDGFIAMAVAGATRVRSLCALIGHPEVGEDPAVQLDALGNADRIDRYLLPWLAERDKWEVATTCQEWRIPTTPVLGFEEVLRDEHLRHRRFFESIACGGETFASPRPPYRLVPRAAGGPGPDEG
jgi:crotonobetainyl-CoA:carnitine CoA-transferase CaiB-like acyl-CoA transferase